MAKADILGVQAIIGAIPKQRLGSEALDNDFFFQQGWAWWRRGGAG